MRAAIVALARVAETFDSFPDGSTTVMPARAEGLPE